MKMENDKPVNLGFSGSIGTVASILDILGQRSIGSTYSAIERVLKDQDAEILEIKFNPGVMFFDVHYLDHELNRKTINIYWDPKDCHWDRGGSGGAPTHYKAFR